MEDDHGGTEEDPEPHWRDGLQGFSPSKAAREEEEWVWNSLEKSIWIFKEKFSFLVYKISQVNQKPK